MNKILTILILLFLITACEESYIPKPRGYYRIALPQKSYTQAEAPNYKFEILESSNISIKKGNNSWVTVNYPQLKAALYLTYYHDTNIEKLTEDARKSAYKHAIRADDIVNMPFAIPDKNLYGVVYSIEGNAATPVIFQFTDSISQFVHGAMYFNAESNADSLKPVTAFIRRDIEHIIETFEWKDPK